MILKIAGYILLVAIWSVVRMRSLLYERKTKEAAVYGLLMGVSIVIGALLIAGVKLPSFTVPFKLLLEPIGKRLLKQ
ncbi:hypothetical protein [Paenibacillus sacheonensis]|uniref:Uncharacterized protein n=1 Tax=Paenibacillus sacheonensis TaxID=742054 RepID=A0A7X4YN61_9BACL|nr:hypothetical protein [Paenibacillus sacheonensis]MBM7564869.1 hypothetical protein [Paenibacillus sacheonensis]NBC69417.1 hypothetical protein [Paenibacillus sacheonensis]